MAGFLLLTRLMLSGQNSSSYLPDITSSRDHRGHKVKDTEGQIYEWDGPLPPAPARHRPTRPAEPKMHKMHKHKCAYYRFIRKGMAQYIPVSNILIVEH